MEELPEFKNDFFAANRQRLRQRLANPEAVVVITANGVQQRSNDTAYDFVQDSYFWYLTGIDNPDIVLVLDGHDEYLILPQENAVRDVFDGSVRTSDLMETSGIREVLSQKEGRSRVTSSLQREKTAYVCMPGKLYDGRMGLYTHQARRRLVQSLRRNVVGLELRDVRADLARLRMTKAEPELAALRTAVSITTQSFAAVRNTKALAACSYESELEARLSYEFRRRGARGHAYTPIVANGKHATTLHYVANSGRMHQDQPTVVDVGAEYRHYAADITRTIMPTKPSKRQESIFTAVRETQQYALSLLKPGVFIRQYEQAVVHEMGKHLKLLGLISDANDTAQVRRYYPHATSHFLGLDVHDVGDYSVPLEDGMVVTCEPGIYVPEEGIGIRLEDDVIITKKSIENLSADCSYDLFTV